ncbi:MAG: DUF2514 family protein [Burkholderiaceae bacterium]
MPIRNQLIGAAALVAVAFSVGWITNGWRKDAVIAANQAQHAGVLERQAQAVVASVQAARSEEARRTAVMEKERDNAMEQSEALAADLAAGAAASDRLRRELSKLRARYASGISTIAERSQGQQGTDTIGLLAELYARMDESGREVAGYADRLRIAGMTCERIYDETRGK